MRLPTCPRPLAAAARHRVGLLFIAMAGLSGAAHSEVTYWRDVDSCRDKDFNELACWRTYAGTAALRPGGATDVVILFEQGPTRTVSFANQADTFFRIAALDVQGLSYSSNPAEVYATAVLNVSQGTLQVLGDTTLGVRGPGVINQSGGIFLTHQLWVGKSYSANYGGLSSFTLSGGSLRCV